MLRPGIWKRAEFLSVPPSGTVARFLHRFALSRVSLQLLKIPDQPSSEDIALFEKLMPHVRLSSGVYRTTHRQRFRTLNPVVSGVLRKSFAPSQELRVEDWAASDCLTSAEWAGELFPLFPHLEFAASDLLLFLLEVKKKGRDERFILEPDGSPLQYVRPPFVVRLSHAEPRVFVINWLLARKALRRWNQVRSSVKLSSPNSLPDNAVEETGGFEVRKLALIHPEARQLAKEDTRFTVRRHSAFDRSDRLCNVIRTMNIYNRAYFSQDRLQEGVRAVLSSLTDGGIWVVGRTADNAATSHNVTIFRKVSDGMLEVVERVGQGSEIEDLALQTSRAFAETSSRS